MGNDAPPAPSQEGGVKCVSADSAAPVWRSSVTPESEFKPPVLPKLSGFLLRRAAPDRKEAPVLTRRASHLTSQANARRRKRTPRFPRNAAEVSPFRDGLRIGGGGERARNNQQIAASRPRRSAFGASRRSFSGRRGRGLSSREQPRSK